MPVDLTKHKCGDCGVKPGENHKPGCDIERCAMCGFQLISCSCIYEVNGMPRETLERDHPVIYNFGPNDAMYENFDVEVEKLGGPIPWSGLYPGTEECVEFGWYATFGGAGKGWQSCGPDAPDVSPDLNRLMRSTKWDRKKRRFVLP